MRLPAILTAFCVLAACATAPTEEAAPAVEEDPWALQIEAGRYSVIIDRAYEGAIEGPPAMTAPDPTSLEQAAMSLHYAAHTLYALREQVCFTGLVGGEDCGPLPPPGWLGEPVGASVDAAEIRRRIDWLTDAMGPFVEAGCDAGQSRQTDEFPYYCSVE